MIRRVIAAIWVSALLIQPSLAEAGEVHTPKPGTSERKDILDAVREYVAAELPRPVVFLVHRLNVKDGWAFLMATPQQPDGRAYDYHGTKYQTFIDEGLFDDNLTALLERGQSRWHVLALDIGATDVQFGGWSEQNGAPPEIFP